MGTTQEAARVLADAEGALRLLIEQGLKEQRYSDVAEIAGLAEGVSRLLQNRSHGVAPSPQRSTSGIGVATTRSTDNGVAMRSPAKAGRATYPRFERDGDKLVKIGWSKKSRAEYEHRAPFTVAAALLADIRAKVRDGELFAATDVIPLRTGDESVPDYQTYLALKWFHCEGIVTKHPQDRYSVEPGRLSAKGLDEFWHRIPMVRGSKNGGSKL